jgi:hypothetical protein
MFGTLILTNAAENFTSLAWASSGVITVTRVAFGSGFPGVSDYVPNYTSLKNQIMNGTITSINNLIAGQLTVRANISSANAPSTFNVNEIGVFGKYAGGPETLLAYCSTGANTGDTVTPTGMGTPVIKDYAVLMIFQQAISSSGVIQLVQLVSPHALSHISTGTDPIPVCTSSHTGPLPVSPGDGFQSPVSTSPVTWKPTLIAIKSNTTAYVTTSGNDSTGIIGDATHPFASIQGAMSALSEFVVVAGITVTIQVSAGVYNTSAATVINHPQSSQIQIIGDTSVSTSITATGTMGGSNGSWTVPFTVSSVTGFSVGDYVLVNPTTNISNRTDASLGGIFKVSNVSGSIITIQTTLNKTGVVSTQFTAMNSGTITKLGVVLNCTNDSVDGIDIQQYGLGLLRGIAVIGSGSNPNSGISVSGGVANMNLVGVYNFSAQSSRISISPAAIQVINGSSVYLTNCSCNNNPGQGIASCFGSTINAAGCYFNYNGQGNSVNGCSVIAAFAVLNGGGCVNNGNAGILAGQHSGIEATTVVTNWNGVYGLESTFHSSLYSVSCTTLGNGGDDILASVVSVLSSTGDTFGTSSPAANTSGNQNSYFYSI